MKIPFIVKESLTLFTFSLALAASPARATLMAYEGFASTNYTAGQLSGQSPAVTGFVTNAWSDSTNVSAGGASQALTYSNIVSDNTGGSYSTAVGGRTTRAMSTILGGNTVLGTNTYYISLMMQVSTLATNNYRAFELESQFNNRNFQFGAAADTGSINWGMRVTTASSTYITNVSTVTAVTNQTVFAVMKLRYSSAANDDSVDLWVNPSDLSSEAGSTNFVTISGFDFLHNSAKNISLASFTGTGSASWDEMRVGTTWADVTPVPEPSTYALLGLSGLALAAYRLRRRSR